VHILCVQDQFCAGCRVAQRRVDRRPIREKILTYLEHIMGRAGNIEVRDRVIAEARQEDEGVVAEAARHDVIARSGLDKASARGRLLRRRPAAAARWAGPASGRGIERQGFGAGAADDVLKVEDVIGSDLRAGCQLGAEIDDGPAACPRKVERVRSAAAVYDANLRSAAA